MDEIRWEGTHTYICVCPGVLLMLFVPDHTFGDEGEWLKPICKSTD